MSDSGRPEPSEPRIARGAHLDPRQGARPRAAASTLSATITRLRRGFAARLFASGALNAAAALGAAVAIGLLVARIAERAVEPAPWWMAAALGPALAWGAWRARRETPRDDDLALHLDRRLGLEGRLLAALDMGAAGASAGGWEAGLAARLRAERVARPRLDGAALAGRLALAVAFLAVVLALPPPAPAGPGGPTASAALAASIEGLGADLAALAARGALGAEAERELTERLRELERALGRGEPPTWADLDGLEARIAEEVAFRRDALAGLFDAARGAAARAATPPGGAADPLAARGSRELLAGFERAARAAGEAGLLGELDADLRQRVLELAEQAARAGSPQGGGSGGGERFDPERAEAALRELAGRLEAALAALHPDEVRRLAELAERRGANRGGRDGRAAGDGGTGLRAPGADGGARGGTGDVSRGPGEGPRGLGDPGGVEGGPGGAAALPRGGAGDASGAVLGAEVGEPSLGPERDATSGRAGAAATGDGRAAARAGLSPRQRSALERYHAAGAED